MSNNPKWFPALGGSNEVMNQYQTAAPALPTFLHCPNCRTYLHWAYVINGVYCYNCRLVDLKFSKATFPSIEGLKKYLINFSGLNNYNIELPDEPNYEMHIYKRMKKLFEKDILEWKDPEYKELLKIKTFEDSYYIEDRLSLKMNDYENNFIFKYCIVDHFSSKSKDYIYKVFLNENFDNNYNQFSDLHTLITECIAYSSKIDLITNRKDQEFFDNYVMDLNYNPTEKHLGEIMICEEEENTYLIRYDLKYAEARLRTGSDTFERCYLKLNCPNPNYFCVHFKYEKNSITMINCKSWAQEAIFCTEQLKNHFKEILNSKIPTLNLDDASVDVEYDLWEHRYHGEEPYFHSKYPKTLYLNKIEDMNNGKKEK